MLRSVSLTASATSARPPERTAGGVIAGCETFETGAGGGDVTTGFGVGVGVTTGGGAITGPPPPGTGGMEKTIVAALGPTFSDPSLTVTSNFGAMAVLVSTKRTRPPVMSACVKTVMGTPGLLISSKRPFDRLLIVKLRLAAGLSTSVALKLALEKITELPPVIVSLFVTSTGALLTGVTFTVLATLLELAAPSLTV